MKPVMKKETPDASMDLIDRSVDIPWALYESVRIVTTTYINELSMCRTSRVDRYIHF